MEKNKINLDMEGKITFDKLKDLDAFNLLTPNKFLENIQMYDSTV